MKIILSTEKINFEKHSEILTQPRDGIKTVDGFLDGWKTANEMASSPEGFYVKNPKACNKSLKIVHWRFFLFCFYRFIIKILLIF